MFNPYIKKFFVFMPSNNDWMVRRKAVAHMFYKERMSSMVSVFKEHLNTQCEQWLADIKKHGKARMDISQEFELLFSRTINHICLGEDINDDTFDWLYMDRASRTFTEKKVNMKEANHNMLE
jgi:cytochrome P450